MCVSFLPCYLAVMTDAKNCPVCTKGLPKDGRFLTCAECRSGYHLGKSCSGVADSTFLAMGQAKRDTWKCKSCRSSLAEGNTVATAQPESDINVDSCSVAQELTALRQQLESINKTIVGLLPLQGKVDALLAIRNKIDEVLNLKQVVTDLQNSVQFMSSAYDSLLAQNTARDAEKRVLEEKVASLATTVSHQSGEIGQLRAELNNADQYSRLSNLELHGLSVTKGENLKAELTDLASKLELRGFQEGDIVAIHRLPAKKDKIPPVLVRFASPSIRETWLLARSRLRSLSEKKVIPSMLFLNENLTQANKELFWMTRVKAKEMKYKYVWTKNGKIFARKEEGSSLVKVVTKDDIQKLI